VPGSDTAIIEWFVGDDCAFAFVVVFRERSPRTIEFTEKQTRVIKQAVAAMEFPGRGDDEGEQLAQIARALRIETVPWQPCAHPARRSSGVVASTAYRQQRVPVQLFRCH